MSTDWRRCDGLPEKARLPLRIDVSFSVNDPDNPLGHCLDVGAEDVCGPKHVKWWRPHVAATDAAHPAAESMPEVSDVQPDDTGPFPPGWDSAAPTAAAHSFDPFEDAFMPSGPAIGDPTAGEREFEVACALTVDEAASLSIGVGKAEPVLDKYFGVQDTLNARGARYGDFTENAAISQHLKQVLQHDGNDVRPGWLRCSAVQREALEMIAQKIARILNGDPNYKDNWHDIQGYARLAEERCHDQE